MSWNSNLRRGTDLTTWDWLSFVPDGSTYQGSCIAYDGVRYIYCLNQNGTTTGSATSGSTANFFKYDTWSDAWHKIAASVPSTGAGGDIEYDPVRNVLWTIHGAATTTMYGFNLNNANVLANGNTQVQTTSMAPYTHVSITGTFPATPSMGSSMALVEDVSYEAPFATGTVVQGISTTSWFELLYPTLINPAHAGCALRFTSGTAANVSGTFPNIRRTIYGTNPSYGVQPVLQTYSSGGAPTATTFVVGSATGIVAGMYVSGTGIPTGSYVTSVSGTTITISQTIAVQVAGTIAFHPYRPLTTTYTGTSGQYTIVVASASGIGLGMPVAGTGIATGAVVTAISGTTITLSLPNTSSQTTIACGFFSDGAIYTPISGSASSTTITVGSASFLSVGMTITGTGIFPNTYITNISGTTITLSNATTTAVFGTGTFTASFMQVVLATALPSTPAYGDAYSVDFPQGTSSGTNTSSTLNDTTQNWTSNIYRDSDIVITSGTGVGQRRRILSHTTTAITIGVGTAGTAQAGNDRTGGWAVTPDATSQYKIVPSSDFIYVSAANNSTTNTFVRMDLNTNTGTASGWIAQPVTGLSAAYTGSTLMYGKKLGPFSLFMTRGNSTATVYRYDIGLQTWTIINAVVGQGSYSYMGSTELLSTGATSIPLYDQNRIAIQYQNSTRLYAMRLADTFVEPLGTQPYTAPNAYEGRRMKHVVAPNGTQWLYLLRAGTSEFFRYGIEHI